jgi:hypothetical protein
MANHTKPVKIRKKMTNLVQISSSKIVSFLDNSKHFKSIPVFDKTKKYKCFWCTEPIENGNPIGCPLRLITNFEIEKEKIRETDEADSNFISQKKFDGTFLTEKVFHSFNCVEGFIEENKNNPKYRDSSRLNHIMFHLSQTDDKKLEVPFIISPAPCRSLKIEYGGTLTVDQYNDSFCNAKFENIGSISMVPVSNLFIVKNL